MPVFTTRHCKFSVGIFVFVVLLIFQGTHVLYSENITKGETRYEVVVAKNVMVPMRDGVRMATDIYRPARGGEAEPGRFPTLLSRTPYGKNGSEPAARFLAKHGYIVLIQDVRGRFESEGTFYIYVNEGQDGYDAVEWAAAQPWSNGAHI